MIVIVDELFAKNQYNKMLEELYMIEICKSYNNSSYSFDERQKDNFLKSILNVNSCK
jgi:hypothetical protein